MRFSPVPNVSKSKINKAGKILKASDSAEREIVWATDIAGQWRACHAYPINTFQATLRRKKNILAKRLSLKD